MQDDNGHNNGKNRDETPNTTMGADSNIIRFQRRPKNNKTGPNANAQTHDDHAPLINLPPVTKWMIASFVVVQLIMSFALGSESQYWVMAHLGFVPAYYTGQFGFGWPMIVGPFTYMLIHGGWLHVGLNSVMMMAFGAGCERALGAKRMILLFVLCGLAAAAFHMALNWGSEAPVIGASGSISGLFAAIMLILYAQNPGGMGGKYGLWPFILLWIVISVAFGSMGGPGGSTIAWAAHIGGFIAGFAFFPLVMRLKI